MATLPARSTLAERAYIAFFVLFYLLTFWVRFGELLFRFAWSWELAFSLAFEGALLLLCYFDFREKLIPQWSLVLAAGIGLALLAGRSWPNLLAVSGGLWVFVCGFLIFDLLTHLGNAIEKKQASLQGLLALWVGTFACGFYLLVGLFVPSLGFSLWGVVLAAVSSGLTLWALPHTPLPLRLIQSFLKQPVFLSYILPGILILSFVLGAIPVSLLPALALLSFLSFFLIELILPLFTSQTEDPLDQDQSVFGGADATVFALLGLNAGFSQLLFGGFISGLLGSLVFVLLKIFGEKEMAFIPLLVLGHAIIAALMVFLGGLN